METKRQKQVAGIVRQYLNDVFLKEGKEITESALVTISNVKMTPDLLSARVYVSLYNTDHADKIMRDIQANSRTLKHLLGQRIRHQVRKLPELEFFRDDTLDEVFRLEQIFKELNAQKKAGSVEGDDGSDDAGEQDKS